MFKRKLPVKMGGRLSGFFKPLIKTQTTSLTKSIVKPLLSLSLLSASVAQAENWVPIGSGDITIFVPSIQFKAEQTTPGDYTLSWMEQSNATSYKIERLSADTSTPVTSNQIPTHWVTVSEQSTTTLNQSHGLTDLDLGGAQTYRLSTCNSGTCEVIDTLTYEVPAEDFINAIPQNVALNVIPSTTPASANLDTRNSTEAANPYAWGKGYHFETGHEVRETTFSSTSLTSKSSKQESNITTKSNVDVSKEDSDIVITWDPVEHATHYVLSKVVDRGTNPTYETLYNSTISRYYASDRTFRFGGFGRGTHVFVVYGCTAAGFCGGASQSVSATYTPEIDLTRQPQNVNIPSIASEGAEFTISWQPPTNPEPVVGYYVTGELQNGIATVSSNTFSITRNSPSSPNNLPLAAGRLYCYKIRPLYSDGSGGTVNGTYSEGKCIQIGTDTPLDAPDTLTLVNRSAYPDANYYSGYVFSWSAVMGAEYYQLDRQVYDSATGILSWVPVYTGAIKEFRMFFTEIASQGFRVSACKNNGQCGNYRRLYFNSTDNQIDPNELKRPSCLNVPKSTEIGESFKVSWCPPQTDGVTNYELLNSSGTVIASGLPSTSANIGMTLHGLPYFEQSAFNSATDYCYTIKAYFGSTSYEYINNDPQHGCGAVQPPNVAPTITPTTPTVGENFFTFQEVIASATASDSDGYIAKVEFKLNSGSWQEDTSSLYSHSFGQLTQGTHTIYYRAKDNEGAYSSVVNRTINVAVRDENITLSVTKDLRVKGEISLGWNAVEGAQTYHLERNFNGGNWVNLIHSKPLGHDETNSEPGTYNYRVKACYSQSDCTDWSNTLSLRFDQVDGLINYLQVSNNVVPGNMSYQTGVSDKGDILITVPVNVPPGIRGMQPDLTMHYSSSRISDIQSNPTNTGYEHVTTGDYIGLGWRFTGLSMIHLCQMPENGSQADIYFSNNYWCLDGERLVKIRDADSANGLGVLYSMKKDKQVRIERFGHLSGAGAWFKVNMPNGTVREYGRTTDSKSAIYSPRIYPPNKYGINKATDVYGNEINYKYFTNSYQNQLYPLHITYGEGESGNPGNGDTKITFKYSAREDWSDTTGDEIKFGSNLIMMTAIEMEQKNSSGTRELIRKYINYSEHPGDIPLGDPAHRQLAKIQECGYTSGANETCYAPIQLIWNPFAAHSLPRYVKKVIGSLGATTEFEITTLRNNESAGRFTERPFGNGALPPGTKQVNRLMHMVTAMHRSNGIGGTNTIRYAYQGNGIESEEELGLLGFYAKRITNEQTGQVSYIKRRLDYPFIGKAAEKVTYTQTYSNQGNNILVSKTENNYTQHITTHANGAVTNFPYLLASTNYQYEAGQLVNAKQVRNDHTFTNNLLSNTTEISQTAASATSAATGSIWGQRGTATLSNILRSKKTERSFNHRNTGGVWLMNFNTNETVSHYPSGALTDTSVADRVQTVEHTPYTTASNVATNDKHTSIVHKGDTNLERTTTLGYTTTGLLNSTTITGSHIQSRTVKVNAFANGRFEQITENALEQVSTNLYDMRFGIVNSVTDANLRTTVTNHDPLGRITSVEEPDNVTVTTTREFCQSIGCASVAGVTPFYRVTTSSPIAPTQVEYFDRLDRRIRIEHTAFDNTSLIYQDTIYDSRGRVLKESKPYDSTTLATDIAYTEFAYDDKNRIINQTYPDGSSVSTVYTQNSGKTKATVTRTVYSASGSILDNQVKEIQYNRLGEIENRTDAKGTLDEVSTSYTYDGAGLPETIIVNNQPAISFEYDNAGNRTQLNDPNIGSVTTQFNAMNLTRSQTDNAGQTNSYGYDLLNRKISETHHNGSSSSWVYDRANQSSPATYGALISRSFTPAGQQTPSFSEVHAYQTNTHLQSVTTTINVPGFTGNNARIYQKTFTWDTYGRLNTTTWPGNLVTSNNYNAAKYLSAIYDNSTNTALQTINAMDALKNITNETYGNGTTTVRTYNPITSRIENINTTKGNVTIQDNDYHWRSNGLLEKREQGVNDQGVAQHKYEVFSYDTVNRLTEMRTYADNAQLRLQNISYDLQGNISSKTSDVTTDKQVTGYQYGDSLLTDTGVAGINAVTDVSIDTVPHKIRYDDNGNINHYGVDENGNAPGADRFVTWNDRNLVTAITKGDSESDTTPQARDSFIYGPDLQRFYKKSQFTDEHGVLQTEHTFYIGSIEEIIPAATSEYSLISKAQINSNITHIRTISRVGAPDESMFEYLHKDHLGSTEVVTDESGYRLISFAYDAFGSRRHADWSRELTDSELKILADTMNVKNRRGYTGHEHLERTGMIHMNGRVYDPVLGRFLSPDPLVSAPNFSQSYNRYSYVMNNPMGTTDPSGYSPSCTDETGCTEETSQDNSDEKSSTNTQSQQGKQESGTESEATDEDGSDTQGELGDGEEQNNDNSGADGSSSDDEDTEQTVVYVDLSQLKDVKWRKSISVEEIEKAILSTLKKAFPHIKFIKGTGGLFDHQLTYTTEEGVGKGGTRIYGSHTSYKIGKIRVANGKTKVYITNVKKDMYPINTYDEKGNVIDFRHYNSEEAGIALGNYGNHELGHRFGMQHESEKGYIMQAKSSPSYTPNKWSVGNMLRAHLDN